MSDVSDVGLILLLIATIMNGLLAGLSLNKSVVELPAGRRMGSLAFSQFSRAADLGNGLPFYAALGLMTPAITILAAALVVLGGSPSPLWSGLGIAASVFSIAHVGVSAGAAPNMLRIGRLGNDVGALDEAYRRFRSWQDARAVLQVATFGLVVSTLGLLT
jgi:hypothetical protein